MGRRHQLLLDAAVPVVAGGVAAVGVVVHGDAERRPLTLALALAAAAVLAARRRAPVATLAASAALVLALLAVDHTAGAAAVVAPAVALYSVALLRGRLHQLAAGISAVAAVVAADLLVGGSGALELATLGHAALVAVPLLAAEAVRNRRSYVALLLEQLELAGHAREEEARRRVEQERLRIARDLHDAVAHALTTINVQAGVAVHLLDRDPGNARSALVTIEEASHEALDELRAIVGVLRDPDERVPLQPPPGLDAVRELVERSRALGLDVTLDVTGVQPERLPEAVQLTAYRIVQESLTNVRRHAAPAPARVGLSFEPERLLVTVENGAGAARNGSPGAGVGVLGMQERAAAVGGTLRAASSPQGFRVVAELPYRASE